eukprot:447405-Prorocentrum_minimum.AAC.2
MRVRRERCEVSVPNNGAIVTANFATTANPNSHHRATATARQWANVALVRFSGDDAFALPNDTFRRQAVSEQTSKIFKHSQ